MRAGRPARGRAPSLIQHQDAMRRTTHALPRSVVLAEPPADQLAPCLLYAPFSATLPRTRTLGCTAHCSRLVLPSTHGQHLQRSVPSGPPGSSMRDVRSASVARTASQAWPPMPQLAGANSQKSQDSSRPVKPSRPACCLCQAPTQVGAVGLFRKRAPTVFFLPASQSRHISTHSFRHRTSRLRSAPHFT